MHFDESNEVPPQQKSLNESEIALTNYCLKCSAELSDEQSYCVSCATQRSPSKQAKLLVLLLISISFVIGLILIVTA